MTGQDGKPAKVSLARITIDAPPGKVTFYSTYGDPFLGTSRSDSCKQVGPTMQVYQKLAQVGSWNNWHTSAWVLRSPGLEKLAPGEKFAYTAPFVLGNVQSQVEESHDGKVRNHQQLLSLIRLHLITGAVSCHEQINKGRHAPRLRKSKLEPSDASGLNCQPPNRQCARHNKALPQAVHDMHGVKGERQD